jgi:hypothetical protein
MRPVSVFANGPGSEIEQLRGDLHGRWRQATRAVMVLLSLHGLPPAQIAELLTATRPPCVAGSAGSAAKGRQGWPTGPGPDGPGWAGSGWPAGSPRCSDARARGPCRGSGGTWAGCRSACARCTGGSGWWRSGGGPGSPPAATRTTTTWWPRSWPGRWNCASYLMMRPPSAHSTWPVIAAAASEAR